MNVTVQIPDDLAARLGGDGDLSRRALEALGLEAYQAGHITKAELRRLLGFDTRYELDGFLKAHGIWMKSSVDDLRREVAALQNFPEMTNLTS